VSPLLVKELEDEKRGTMYVGEKNVGKKRGERRKQAEQGRSTKRRGEMKRNREMSYRVMLFVIYISFENIPA
jgi:hypothetical protein